MGQQTPELVEASPEKLAILRELRAKKAELERQIAAHAPPRPRPWHTLARAKQLPPEGAYSIWLIMSGRAWGKTATGANWIAEQAARNPDTEWAIVAPTWRDCRKVCLEGKSGLLKALLPGELESMNASDLTIRLTNGSRIYGYSSDGYERLRGANLSGAWVDEAAVMANVDDLFTYALLPALRIGERPRVLITTTPRPIKFLKNLIARDDGSVVVTRGSMWDNAANLSPTMLAELKTQYEGTRAGRQELEGELLEDIEGALWSHEMLDSTRVKEAPTLSRIVVGVDPAVTSGEKADYTGIVVVGRSGNGHLYVLENATMKGTPHQCMRKAVDAYHRWKADRIVGEVNNGGDYIEGVLRTVDENVAYKTVRATRGKLVRAEPIAALWEQGRGHIVGVLPKLEDQMASFTSDAKESSPDDLDACFVAGTPVLTDHGEVPIEEISIGDLVWTRAGWKPVLRSECTQRNAEVITVELTNGQNLTGTPNHWIWTENGWSRLDALVWGDTLEGWTTTIPQLLNSTVSSTSVTPKLSCGHTVSTIKPDAAADEIICTAISGARNTLIKKFRSVGTSITKIMTRSTMIHRILYCFRLPNIKYATEKISPKISAMHCASTLHEFGPWPRSGTVARKGSPGTASMGRELGKIESMSLGNVSSAERCTAVPRTMDLVTVHGHALTGLMTNRTVTSDASHARYAELSSGSPSTELNPRRVAVSVLRPYVVNERRDVFDLMVADQHEFVASGVVVHNCVWACTELNVGSSSLMYLSALANLCSQCDMPNMKSATMCRGCGEKLDNVA